MNADVVVEPKPISGPEELVAAAMTQGSDNGDKSVDRIHIYLNP